MARFTGVVLEKKHKEAIIMTSDGQFKRVKVLDNFDLGDEVTGEEKKQQSLKSLMYGFSVAAAVLLTVLVPSLVTTDKLNFGQNTAAYFTNEKSSEEIVNQVVATVTVEINPSLVLELNEKATVIKAKALNNDGEKVLTLGNLEGEEVNSAVKKITERSYSLGYIKDKVDNVIKLTLTEEAKDKITTFDGAKTQQELRASVEEFLNKKRLKGEVKLYHSEVKMKQNRFDKKTIDKLNNKFNKFDQKTNENSNEKFNDQSNKKSKIVSKKELSNKLSNKINIREKKDKPSLLSKSKKTESKKSGMTKSKGKNNLLMNKK